MHQSDAPRKPRRLGLYLPFAILLLVAVLWTGFWLWARSQAQTRMDAAVAQLNSAGYRIAWRARHIGGYPFRMDVDLEQAEVREPSGWALQAPLLQAEANVYTPLHWVLAAPQGLTFVRPQKGPVTVTGTNIRAALWDFDRRPPSFDFQGVDLVFRPAAEAEPFFLSAAKKVELHLRAGPDDQGGVYLSVEQGKARLSGLLARVAGDKPVDLNWNGVLSKMSAFDGPDWAGAVSNWAQAGGRMKVQSAGMTAGAALIGVRSGELAAGRDGRLEGVLDVNLRQAPQALDAMGEGGVIAPERAAAAASVAAARQGPGELAHAAITFQAGETTLGPVAIGPAPKVYDPR